MALAVIGPAKGNKRSLASAASHWVRRADIERVVYLGQDGALERVVESWAKQLVGDDATDRGLWERAALACADASSEAIDSFVEAERRRDRLRVLESLPSDGARTIELMAGKWLLMSHRFDSLGEDDLAPASYIVVGEAKEAFVTQRGSRWVIAPGPVTTSWGAVFVEQGKDVQVTLLDGNGGVAREERLKLGPGVKLRVSGES